MPICCPPIAFRASLVNDLVTPYLNFPELIVPFDTVDIDTNNAFILAFAGPGNDLYAGNSYPTFIVPEAGYYLFQSQTYFQETADNVQLQVFQALTHMNSLGDTIFTYGSSSGSWTVGPSDATGQLSISLSIIAQCAADDLLVANSNYNTPPGTSATLSIIPTGISRPHDPAFMTTYFAGHKIGDLVTAPLSPLQNIVTETSDPISNQSGNIIITEI